MNYNVIFSNVIKESVVSPKLNIVKVPNSLINKAYNDVKLMEEVLVYCNRLSNLNYFKDIFTLSFLKQIKNNSKMSLLGKVVWVTSYIQYCSKRGLVKEFLEKFVNDLKNKHTIFWQDCQYSYEKKLDSFYFKYFSEKATKNTLEYDSFQIFEKQISASIFNSLLNSNNSFFLLAFLEDKIGFFYKVESLPIPLDKQNIFHWENLSQKVENNEGWLLFCDSNFTNIKNIKEGNHIYSNYSSNFLLNMNEFLMEFKVRNDYDLIMHKYLPFLGQYRDWEPKTDQHQTNNIAEESEEEPFEILYLHNVGKNLIRISKKPLIDCYLQFFSIMYMYYSYFLSKVAFIQSYFMSSTFYYGILSKIIRYDSTQSFIYSFLLKPFHNISKIIFGFMFLFLIFPYKNLEISQSVFYYSTYVIPFFIFIQILNWLFKFIWFFFTGIERKPTKFDIDINVLIFTPLFLVFPCFMYADFILDSENGFIAIFKLWYLNHLR